MFIRPDFEMRSLVVVPFEAKKHDQRTVAAGHCSLIAIAPQRELLPGGVFDFLYKQAYQSALFLLLVELARVSPDSCRSQVFFHSWASWSGHGHGAWLLPHGSSVASASICSIACSHVIPCIPIPMPPWASRHVTHHLQHRSPQVSCRSVGAGSKKKQAGYEERLERFDFINQIDFNSYEVYTPEYKCTTKQGICTYHNIDYIRTRCHIYQVLRVK